MNNATEEYSIETYKSSWREDLYKVLRVVLENDKITEYDSETTYDIDTVVFTEDNITGAYPLYKSLISENTEPLNNEGAWELQHVKYIPDKKLEQYLQMTLKIFPQSVNYLLTTKDEKEIPIRDYALGLYMSCFIANRINTASGASSSGTTGGVGHVKHILTDGIAVTYQIPDWALEERNIFFNNPFGVELLGLYRKLFVSTPFKTEKYFNDMYNTFRFADFKRRYHHDK